MNRRRFLLSFGWIVPIIALGWSAKTAASWRPVSLGPFGLWNKGQTTNPFSSDHGAITALYFNSSPVQTVGVAFDAATEKKHEIPFDLRERGLLGVQNGFLWSSTYNSQSKLFLLSIVGESKKIFRSPIWRYNANSQQIRILPEQNKIVVVTSDELCVWDFRSSAFNYRLAVDSGERCALSRDAKTLTSFNHVRGFWTTDNSTLRKSKTVPLKGIHLYEQIELSPYGRFALLDQPAKRPGRAIVSTATRKVLWRFTAPSLSEPLYCIADDERTIFVRQFKSWEVHDLQSGTLLRRLPAMPGIQAAASSPDGSVLFDVANGTLYRQRAR